MELRSELGVLKSTPSWRTGFMERLQQYRTQEQNREDALQRLAELIRSVAKVEKARRPTKPTLGSKKRRLEGKSKRAEIKAGRGRVEY